MNSLQDIESIFMKWLLQRNNDLADNNKKLVHYTSSENALNILAGGKLWMRNPSCMNDYSELQHGMREINNFFFDEKGNLKPLGASRDALSIIDRAITKFNETWSKLSLSDFIFVASLSEKQEDEDSIGRLSMWRAYGGNNGVALELNNPPKTPGLNVFLHPVIYSSDELKSILNELMEDIETNLSLLQGADQNEVIDLLVLTLLFLVVCKKHEGFKEEREWRIIYVLNLIPSIVKSPISINSVAVNGVSQLVAKLPIDGGSIPNINLKNMLHRILIGPTQFPSQQAMSFIHTLNEQGIPNAGEKVVSTGIPLRT